MKKANTANSTAAIFDKYAAARAALAALHAAARTDDSARTRRAVERAEKRVAALSADITAAGIITAENLQAIAERIGVRALKTYYQTSGQPFVYALYCNLIGDIVENKRTGAPLSDGYDIVQTAALFLCEHIGRALHDCANTGETDKDGNPIDVLRATFRAVNRYIKNERTRIYKHVYIEDIDENGESVFLQVPFEYDAPTAQDLLRVRALVYDMRLSQAEKRFLSYRLRGKSLDDIARAMGVKRDTLNAYRARVKAKAAAIGLTPER